MLSARTPRTLLSTLALSFLVVFLAAACGGQTSSSGGGGTVKIAVAGPMSGSDAQYGQDFWRGATMAVQDAARTGASKGLKVSLQKFDDVDDTTQAADVAQKISSDRSISAVVGHFTTSTTLATMPIYKRAQITLVDVSASSPNITQQGDKWLFRDTRPNNWDGQQYAKQLSTYVHPKKVATVYLNSAYGLASNTGFVQAAKQDGLNVVSQQIYDPSQTDFTNLVQRLKQSGADAVYMSSYYNDAALIIKQAVAAGVTTRWYAGAVYSPAFLSVGGSAVNGNTWSSTTPPSKSLSTFTAEYQKQYGGVPDSFVNTTYSAVLALIKAAKDKGTSRSEIRDGMAALNGLPTPVGKLKFNRNGQFLPTGQTWLRVKDGKWVTVPNLAPDAG